MCGYISRVTKYTKVPQCTEKISYLYRVIDSVRNSWFIQQIFIKFINCRTVDVVSYHENKKIVQKTLSVVSPFSVSFYEIEPSRLFPSWRPADQREGSNHFLFNLYNPNRLTCMKESSMMLSLIGHCFCLLDTGVRTGNSETGKIWTVNGILM